MLCLFILCVAILWVYCHYKQACCSLFIISAKLTWACLASDEPLNFVISCALVISPRLLFWIFF